MLNTKKTFKMLPFVVETIEKLELVKFIKEKRDNANQYQILTYISKNIFKVENEICNIVAIYEDNSMEEIEEQHIVKTLQTLKKIFDDKELIDFFKAAMQ